MFTKNSPKEGFVNGTLGEVKEFNKYSGNPIVKTRDGKLVEVEPMDWAVEENGKVRAKITQLPLRLAWAITVHKSQGMSLDEAVMDLTDVLNSGRGMWRYLVFDGSPACIFWVITAGRFRFIRAFLPKICRFALNPMKQ